MSAFLRQHAVALGILGLHFLTFAAFNLRINPHPDMLDHWVWSRHWALSYYEHPPMVAWAIALISVVAGNSEYALEFGAQAYNLLILALAYGVAFRFFGKLAAIFALLLLVSTPYFSIGSVFLHIDQPFLIFWLLNLFCLIRFHQTQATRWLLAIGVLAGLGALSKYITILFYIGLFLHLMLYKECRKHLLNPWLYLAGVISLAVFAPVLIWNYQNDWVSFRFQFKRGLSGAGFGENFVLFTLGHLVLFSLIWSWWVLQTLWKKRSQWQGTQPEAIIAIVSLVPLAFFTLMSFRGSIADPHWANVSYLGTMMLGGLQLAKLWEAGEQRWIQRRMGLALGLNGLVLLVLVAHIERPLYDFTEYELKYFSTFTRKGFSPEVVQKLRTMESLPPMHEAEFIQAVQKRLTPEEWLTYQKLILQTARNSEADLATKFLAWDQSALQLQELLQKTGQSLPEFIISKEFQLSSALSFYLPNHPFPHSIQKPERNQWSPPEAVQQGRAIIVCYFASCRRVIKQAQERFELNADYLGEFRTESNGRIVRELEVYTLKTQ